MNEGDLVEKIAWEFNLSEAETHRIIEFALEEMSKDLMVGERVYFRDFGALHKEQRQQRRVKHPETGEWLTIPEHYTVDFRPSEALEERVNEVGEENGN